MKQNGLVINIDINSVTIPFLTKVTENGRVPAPAELHPFIDIYRDTDVTDVAVCVFCQYSATPSKVFSDAVFKRYQTMENGVPVNYIDRYGALVHLYENGIDPHKVWFDQCREAGLRSWLSIRMNDCHEPDADASFLRSEFFYTARENGWMIGPAYGYFRYCYDYAVPEVRQKMLDYIDEQLRAYDPDGLELDFMREAYCFNYSDGKDHVSIMNDFLRNVKKLVTAAEERRGHKIPILIRVPRDPETALDYGFDPVAWEKENLCDVLNPTPRWETCDSDIPVDRWKKLLPKTELHAGIEILVSSVCGRDHAKAEITRGYADLYFAESADKIYLYNYYVNPFAPDAMMQEVHRTCGTPDHTAALPTRTVVTYQDITLDPSHRYRPLPLAVKSGETSELSIGTGRPCGREAYLILGTDKNPASVIVDGTPAAASEEYLDDPLYANASCAFRSYRITLKEETIHHNIKITAAEDLTVSYAEIRLK